MGERYGLLQQKRDTSSGTTPEAHTTPEKLFTDQTLSDCYPRIQRMRVGFSPHTNFVRVTPAEGPLDSGPLDSFEVMPDSPKY